MIRFLISFFLITLILPVFSNDNEKEVEKITNYKLSISTYHLDNGEDSIFFQKIDSLYTMLNNYNEKNEITEDVLLAYVFYAKSISYKNPLKSIKILKEKIKISNSHELLHAKANALHELARILFRQRLINEALESYMLTSKTFLKLEDWNAYAYSLIDIGNVYFKIEEYDNSLKYYKKAENIFLNEAKKDQINYNLAVCYNNYGQVAYSKGELDSALYFYKYAYKLRKDGDYKATIPHSLYYIAFAFSLKQEYDSAEYYAKKAIVYSEENKIQNHIAFSNYIYGRILRDIDTSKAIFYLKKSINLADENDDLNLKMTSSSVLGKFYISINLDSAKHYLTELYELSVKYQNRNYKLISTKKLAHIYSLEENYKKKAEFLEILNELIEKDIDKTIMKSKFLYEQDQWLQENADIKTQSKRRMLILVFSLIILGMSLLTIFIIIRNRKLIKAKSLKLEKLNSELKELIQKRDMLYSIIAHDLRGPIGSSENILNLINNNELEKKEIPFYLKKLQVSLAATFDLLNSLLSWVYINKEDFVLKKKNYKILPIINDISILYNNQFENKNIKFITKISNNIEAHFDLNSISTVFRNIISNAIKFCNSGGKIELSAKEDENFVFVSIKDDGVGMSKEILGKLFNEKDSIIKKGTNNEFGTGFGLALSKELINVNGGEIYVNSELNKGSEFIVKIPKR